MSLRQVPWGETFELRVLKQNPMEEDIRDSPNIIATMRSLWVGLQSCREDNERMIKAQEEQNQLNVAMLQSLKNIQRRINFGHWEVNPKGSRSGSRIRKMYSSGSTDSEGSTGGSISSSHMNKRKRHY